MSSASGKTSTSVSLDKELVQVIEEAPGVKKSTLLNDLGWQWAKEQGYINDAD